VETEELLARLVWTIRQLVLFVAFVQNPVLQCWLSWQILKASPWLLFFRLTVRTLGDARLAAICWPNLRASKLRIFLTFETQADLSSANIPKVK
jgi:hypothetical protein